MTMWRTDRLRRPPSPPSPPCPPPLPSSPPPPSPSSPSSSASLTSLPPPSAPSSRPNERRVLLLWFFVLALLFAAAQSDRTQGRAVMDTRQYLAHSYMLQGLGREEASRRALDYFCDSVRVGSAQRDSADLAHYREHDAGRSAERECRRTMGERVARNARREDVTGYMALFSDPRMSEIFATRPGYPLFTVPFVSGLGPVAGLWLAALVATVAGSGLVVLVLRTLGVSVPLALTGQVLYYALPTGKEAMLPQCEGLLLCLLLAALLGCARLLRGRVASGTAIAVLAFAGAAVVKYAQTLLVVAGIAVMAAVLLGARRLRGERPPRPERVLLVTAAALAAAIELVVAVFGLPSTGESLQELLSVHYTRSPVGDVGPEFWRLSLAFWREWLRDALTQPLVLLLLVCGAWGAVRHHRPFACVLAGIALAGLANQAGHPEMSVGPRLMVMAMLLPVCGIPLLLESHVRRRVARGPEPDAAGPPHADDRRVPAPAAR
ncbi:hypothetical protein OG802_13840 [Streptomyces sp. NBC_00704]|uniref:hypothetical protein n=1 Tax=Streptomyces sp. NBC_00704 TaxID=2975809 RepID=UPI002E375785|nr:hypothetical protein [Streptomyces sp. NBC_00704]